MSSEQTAVSSSSVPAQSAGISAQHTETESKTSNGRSRVLDHNTPTLDSKYTLGKVLGAGQYGSAYEAVNKETQEHVAVKTINKTRFKLNEYAFQIECIRTEIGIMKSVDHPNIIKLLDVFEDEEDIHLVMELCQGGELFDRIKEKRQYSEKEAQLVLRQILQGIDTLHSFNIAHCDLKPDNFLFVSKEDDSLLKIIDFGMSRKLKRRQTLKYMRGTPYYIAPEVLEQNYTTACDMWSLGVIMFVMLFGFPPFYGDNEQVIFTKIRRGFDATTRKGYGAWFPESVNCTASAKDLMRRLLTRDPLARLSSRECLEHPWMQGLNVPLHPLPGMVLEKLTSFVKKTKFANAMLCHLTQMSMTKDEYDALAKTFRYIDRNGDGVLTVEEFKQAMYEADNKLVDEETIRNIISTSDMDGDGTISWKELLLATTARRYAAKEERLYESFRTMDLNNDGRLSVSELRAALKMSDEEIKDLIKEVDIDQNGEIDYDEFYQVFCDRDQREHEEFVSQIVGDLSTGEVVIEASSGNN